MIMLELLYLLVFVGCLLISFAWVFFRKKKTEEQAFARPFGQNISTIFICSHKKSDVTNSQIHQMVPQTQIHARQQTQANNQNQQSAIKQAQEPQPQIVVLINQFQPPQISEQPVTLMPLTLQQPCQLSNNIPQTAQISSFRKGQSSVVTDNQPHEVSQCLRIDEPEQVKKGEYFFPRKSEVQYEQMQEKEVRNDWQQTEQGKRSGRNKQKLRLLAVKQHYKNIIQELKAKLEQVCIRNDQSFSFANPNDTITFSEGDSLINDHSDEARYFLEVKVEQITTLKEELQLHEEMITALLEEDMGLKEKLKTLQQQNQKLKQSVYTATAYKQQQDNPQQSQLLQIRPQSEELLNRSLNIVLAKQEPHNQSFQMPRSQNLKPEEQPRELLSENRQKISSPIRNLYASQILFPFKDPTNLFASRAAENTAMISTISMMSIVEGAISVGLLGQCRFLNEISKKFTINQIKKHLKQRISDAELIYSNSDLDSAQKSFVTAIKSRANLLILIKLASGKCLSFFVERTVDVDSEQGQFNGQGRLMVMDLSRRKTAVCCQGVCLRRKEGLVWGNSQLIIKDCQPLTIASEGTGKIIESKEKALQLLENHGLQISVEFLEIFAIYQSQ